MGAGKGGYAWVTPLAVPSALRRSATVPSGAQRSATVPSGRRFGAGPAAIHSVRADEYGKSDAERAAILSTALAFAVPFWIEDVRHLSEEERAKLAIECSRVISWGDKHDEMRGQHGSGPALFACGEASRGTNKGGPAAVFNALAKGLAIAALQPGGVRFLDQHWQVSPLHREPLDPSHINDLRRRGIRPLAKCSAERPVPSR